MQKMASFSGILPLFYIEAFSPIPEPRQSSEVHLHDYYRDICFLLTRQSFVSDLLKSIPESLLAPCSLPAPVHPAQLNRIVSAFESYPKYATAIYSAETTSQADAIATLT
ncbi:hypothetical protein BLNAU_5281 [Blattamonas nauphoetae]|uniref:Uncharacterized protein n=1 Tax=Blattamonas nauphoetae TaxID=2049346 RepID=A0ABQ9Y7Q8_9EUKA|nr:hypothetical protein BLNAU_5281 [Blattamonas nauphoetae]